MDFLSGAALDALYGGGTFMLWGAFLWGVVGVLLSPCGAAVIPLVVGYIQRNRPETFWGAFFVSLAFSAGIFVNLMFVGALLSGLGTLMSGVDVWISRAVGVFFILIGLNMMGLFEIPAKWIPFSGIVNAGAEGSKMREGLLGALVLGAISGLALGPCSFAFASPILTLSASTSAGGAFSMALAVVASYGLGHCVVLVLAGTFSNALGRLFAAGGYSVARRVVGVLCGLGLIAGGAYFIYTTLPLGLLSHSHPHAAAVFVRFLG